MSYNFKLPEIKNDINDTENYRNKIKLSLPNINALYITRKKENKITTYEDIKRYLNDLKKN